MIRITEAQLTPGTVIFALLVFYIVLGCFMDSLSIILLTVVPAHGLVTSLGYDPIWFGILMVSVVEIGFITPPIGMNLFVIKGLPRKYHWVIYHGASYRLSAPTYCA